MSQAPYSSLSFKFSFFGAPERGLRSLQKLAVDFARASESLKSWGLGEGEDLGVRLFLLLLSVIYSRVQSLGRTLARYRHLLSYIDSPQ